ncbi:MAG: hypothetical protein MJ249_11260 [Kiritimatiellae bacterium]|nr:hypothetical protein [Kiritimatiellia bacterium]
MESAQYSKLFSYLWNIANDVLVQAFEKGDDRLEQSTAGLLKEIMG